MKTIIRNCDKCNNEDSINPITGLCPSCEGEEMKGKVFQIMEVFEDYLQEHNIEIPNKERDEYGVDFDGTEPAILFGSDYYYLEDKIKGILGMEE